jgi:hypothetical protein
MRRGARRLFGQGRSVGRELRSDSFLRRRQRFQRIDRRELREYELRKPGRERLW